MKFSDYPPYHIRILNGCTFSPHIEPMKNYISKSTMKISPVKGFEEAVERRKRVIKEKEEIEMKSNCSRYYELRKLKPKPFKLSSHYNKKKDKNFVYIEVTIMPGKVIKFKLHTTDDANKIVETIKMIYHISDKNQKELKRFFTEQLNVLNSK